MLDDGDDADGNPRDNDEEGEGEAYEAMEEEQNRGSEPTNVYITALNDPGVDMDQ